MEYLSIIAVIAYYLYKAYSAAKKNEKTSEPVHEVPSPSPAPGKKKKGLFDEILEEIERAQQAQAPKPAPAPKPVPSAEKVKRKKPVEAIDYYQPLESNMMSAETEGQRSTIESYSPVEAVPVKKEKRRFAGMSMSPKEALKAQIILEKRF